MQNKKKVAFITGASAGIGKATALLLARNHYDLILGARRIENLVQLKEEIFAISPNSKVYIGKLDVGLSQSVENFLNDAKNMFSDGPDVLVNNAGLAKGVFHLKETPENFMQEMIQTNIMGVFFVTKRIIQWRESLSLGCDIVMLGSIAGRVSYEGGSIYTATKHALRAMTKSLRMELLGKNFRVISVDPGMVETEFSKVRFNDDVNKAAEVYKGMNPLLAQDIAECIFFALSRPPHVNLDEILVMPTDQAAAHKVNRR